MSSSIVETGQLVQLHELKLRRVEKTLAAASKALTEAVVEVEARRRDAEAVRSDMAALSDWLSAAPENEKARFRDITAAREALLARRCGAATEALKTAVAARVEADNAVAAARRDWRIARAKNEAIAALHRRARADESLASALRQDRRAEDERARGIVA
ncbi:hypothetical protein KCG44_09160 [Pacificimonas sp. WHA3]|uniref:Flagellar FliJ protein n=1 Tax=Pacificimonas pallii TaxID=2827236 RepID=A0ABS6SEY2_9SPHN|nr:hypothetical protein [Pacificimonas pallii]MBV7256949.1 hypothetical protein [Pacificimonas pallii]